MILNLFITALAYFLVFIFWNVVKRTNSFWNRFVFCPTCVTFFSILSVLFVYYLFTGIQVLPLALIVGMSITGFAYKLNSDFDRLRKKKLELEDEPYENVWKEFFYQNRLFFAELGLFLLGLIILNVFGIWRFG